MRVSIDRKFGWIAVGVACVLVLIVYGQILIGKVPFPSYFVFSFPAFAPKAPAGLLPEPADIGDLVSSFYPYRTIAARAVREGEIPLWNPYILGGTPLLASSQSAVFYPFTALYYLLPVATAWSLGFMIRPFLAMIFTAALVRSIGGTATGSIAAGVLFAFSGFLTAWQGQAIHDAAIWLPLACLGIVRLHKSTSPPVRDERYATTSSDLTAQRGSGMSVALCAVVFAMPVLAGHPETAFHIAMTAVALAVFLFAAKPSRSFALYFIASGFLAIGLACVQLLPTVQWLTAVAHSLSAPWPPQPWWSLLGWVSRDVLHPTNSFGLKIPEQAAYIGMLAFAAAPLAAMHRCRKIVLFFGLWTAVVLSIAYGVGPAFWLSRHIPIFQALKNHRLILVGTFGLAVLAGLGVSSIDGWHNEHRREHRWRGAMLVSAGSAIALMLIYALRLVTLEMSEPSRYPRISALLLILSAGLLLLRVSGTLRGAGFRIAILVVVGIDVVSFSYGFMPFTDRAHVFPQFEIFDRLPTNRVEPFRIAQLDMSYISNVEGMYGLSGVGGYEVPLRRIREFMKGISEEETDGLRFTTARALALPDRRLDMLNAKYIAATEWNPRYLEFRNLPDRYRFLYTTGDTDIYENLKALPAAFIVPAVGVETIADDAAALQRLKDPAFDPLRSVVLAGSIKSSAEEVSTSPDFRSTVEWVSRRSHDFELNVTTTQRSVLVVSQTFYPGWAAFIDNQQVDVVPANFALTGIEVPSGSHKVRFVFQSPVFRIGLFISVATLTVLLALAISAWKIRRSVGMPAAPS